MMATAISKKIYSQHVADKGKEIIEIIIHRAINIPVIKGKVQKAFVTGYLI